MLSAVKRVFWLGALRTPSRLQRAACSCVPLSQLFQNGARSHERPPRPWQAHKLDALVAYNSVKVGEKHLAELGLQLKEMVAADPPASAAECVAFVKGRKDEWALPDADVIKARAPAPVSPAVLRGVARTSVTTRARRMSFCKPCRAYTVMSRPMFPSMADRLLLLTDH